MTKNPATRRWRYLAYGEFGMAALMLLFGGYVLRGSLGSPETDPHGFVLLFGGILFITSALFAVGAAGLLWLKRWPWLTHLPVAGWMLFLLLW